MRAPVLFVVLCLAAAATIAGCAGRTAVPSAAATVPAPAAKQAPGRSRVVILVMENKDLQQVLSSPHASYLRGLVRRGGTALRSYAVAHPSLPNYVALLSGSTQGITKDCKPCRANGPNLTDQLERAHRSWGAFLQGMPGPCANAGRGRRYTTAVDALAHDTADPSRCRHRLPFTRLALDLRRNRLPDFSLVVPNLCHDTHSCPIATGDRFLRHLVPRLLDDLGPDGFLVLTYDEGAPTDRAGCCGGSDGGHILTLVLGPHVRPGARMTQPVDDYGVLGSVEDAFGLPHLGAAGLARHGSLAPLFVGGSVRG